MSKFVMLIERVGDELEMKLESEDTQGDAQQGTQEQRRKSPSPQGHKQSRNREIKDQRRHRQQHGSGDDDHELSHVGGVHQTMILLDKNRQGGPFPDDKVIFKCAKPFVIDVEFDPSVLDTHDPQPRRSPFVGWDMPKKSAPSATMPGFEEVEGVFINEPRKDLTNTDVPKSAPTDYQFYKATVWSEGLKLDPDWFCDR